MIGKYAQERVTFGEPLAKRQAVQFTVADLYTKYQVGQMLARDPLLNSIDRLWNANPLHDVIPVDWAEIVRALRTVWLRRLPGCKRRPGRRKSTSWRTAWAG